jgi:hypothetical protein
MSFALTLARVGELNPCADRYAYALKYLPADAPITAAQARAAGCTFDDIAWLASAQARKDPAVERRLRLWMSDCAAYVPPVFYRVAPADLRPAQAIEAARAFANGEISSAARAAAWDAAWAAAWDAARAAESNWQFDRLVLWLSEDEPEVSPLPEPSV